MLFELFSRDPVGAFVKTLDQAANGSGIAVDGSFSLALKFQGLQVLFVLSIESAFFTGGQWISPVMVSHSEIEW